MSQLSQDQVGEPTQITSKQQINLKPIASAQTSIPSPATAITVPAAQATASSSSSSTTTTTSSTSISSPSKSTNNSSNMNAANKSNVIIIKYANVTNSRDSPANNQQQELKVFELHGESLGGQIIESRFSNSIQIFDVSYNQLSTLPKDLFCPLSNEVRQLNISHNLLENFDCLGLISQNGQLCLSELLVLDMSFNMIKHLPATGVATLQNLEVLDLSHNSIESLDELSLSSLFKLTKLDLSANKLVHLPERLFHKSKSMQLLNLQFNSLQTNINHSLLSGLTSLEQINLSHNNISLISDSAFVDKINLTRVDLSHNRLSSLRQEVLRVTLGSSTSQPSKSSQLSSGHRQRLNHNGQQAHHQHQHQQQQQQQQPNQPQATSAQVEFLLAANPFVCDCTLEWLRKYQPTSLSAVGRQGQHLAADQLAILNEPFDLSSQNDQAPVMPSESSSRSEMIRLSQVSNSLNSASNQYARIADLEQMKCRPTYRRRDLNAHQQDTGHRSRQRPVAPSGEHHHSLSKSNHHNHQEQQHKQNQMLNILTADPTNFLCRYKSHCFALCHCCEFDACDCEMICPTGCQCYYNLSWQTNIIDCSANNHTVVPDRIPMDVTGLYLDNNNIESLKPSNLIARKSLKTLHLNNSNLQFIANRTFNGLIELQTLYLNDNLLRTLNGYEFEPLAQLRSLYLQSNRLDHINDQTFMYLRSLEVLDLSNNRLSSQNLDLFWSIGHQNIRLRQLSIAHNWWSCQCQSINRFRHILKQKFLLNGSVNIADKNQLRCYYNSTTVGPLILADNSNSLQQQQPLYASYGSSSSSNRQQQPATQLTEINQCSDAIVDDGTDLSELNPPLIYAVTEVPSQTPPNEYPNDPYFISDSQQPAVNFPPGPNPPTGNPFGPPIMIMQPADIVTSQDQRFDSNMRHSNPAMPLTSFILVSILMLGLVAIAVSLFVFIRQQKHKFTQKRHKKSSSGSTSSRSSSASSTAISHAAIDQRKKNNSLSYHQHLHQHQALLGSGLNQMTLGGGQVSQQMNQQLGEQHHHHSASSSSNIYAALVSPTTANSTVVTSATSNLNVNIYSNGSTTASHQPASNGGYWQSVLNQQPAGSQQQQQQQQQSIYGQYVEGSYGHLTAHSQSSYKTGSLYNQCNLTNQDQQQQQERPSDWVKMPKVRQFVSKLVNKSLALGGYRSNSRDSMSALGISDKIYDAYISYDKRDEPFVIQHLSAELEYGQPQYRVADRFRDLPLPSSAYIAEAITSVIGCSHRTIVVLTENYLSSEWCRYELETALNEASMDKSHKIVAVVLEPKCLLEMDGEMRALLTNNPNGNLSMHQPQLVQLDNFEQHQQQLVTTLTSQVGPSQQVSTQTAQLATSRITFINYNERKFWPKLKQLMPMPRPSSQTLTLTTKN